jgi:hypothetical protein
VVYRSGGHLAVDCEIALAILWMSKIEESNTGGELIDAIANEPGKCRVGEQYTGRLEVGECCPNSNSVKKIRDIDLILAKAVPGIEERYYLLADLEDRRMIITILN